MFDWEKSEKERLGEKIEESTRVNKRAIDVNIENAMRQTRTAREQIYAIERQARAIEEQNRIKSNPRLTEHDELYRFAKDAYEGNHLNVALGEIRKAVEKYKIDHRSWFLMGRICLELTDINGAIEALTKAVEYIKPKASTNGREVADIWYHMGVAKYDKFIELNLDKREADARLALKEANEAFENSFDNCGDMLEARSRYRAAQCKALMGNTRGAVDDLRVAITGDRNYYQEVSDDNVFNSMRSDCVRLIDELKHSIFVKAEVKYNNIKSSVENLKAMGGSFTEFIPSEFIESMDYIAVLDYNTEFDRIHSSVSNLIKEREREREKQNALAKSREDEARRQAREYEARRQENMKRDAENTRETIGLVLQIIAPIVILVLFFWVAYPVLEGAEIPEDSHRWLLFLAETLDGESFLRLSLVIGLPIGIVSFLVGFIGIVLKSGYGAAVVLISTIIYAIILAAIAANGFWGFIGFFIVIGIISAIFAIPGFFMSFGGERE